MPGPSGGFQGLQDLRLLGDAMLSRVAATPSVNITSATTTEIYGVDGNKVFIVYRLFALNLDGSNAVTLNFKSEATSILNPVILQTLGSAGDRLDLYSHGLPILIGIAEGDDFDVTTSGATVNVLINASIGTKTPGLT
jgi:hypothetical protein